MKGTAMNSMNMPTNLNSLIATEGSHNQNEVTAILSSMPVETTNSNWMHCNEVAITFRSQIPSLPRNTKKSQVTNVIKRHNVQHITDKII